MTRSLIISKRTLLYLLWYLFVLAIASFIFDIIWGNNSQGDSCDILLWKYGELYQALDGKPCVFTNEFYFAAYISYLILYLLFDYVRYKILGISPSLLWRINEIGVVFIIYWLSIVYKWSHHLLAKYCIQMVWFCNGLYIFVGQFTISVAFFCRGNCCKIYKT